MGGICGRHRRFAKCDRGAGVVRRLDPVLLDPVSQGVPGNAERASGTGFVPGRRRERGQQVRSLEVVHLLANVGGALATGTLGASFCTSSIVASVAAVTKTSSVMMASRAIVLASSRTLPGQRWRSRAAQASGSSCFCGTE